MDNDGVTPLHNAATNGDLDCIERLLENIEGNINPSQSDGKTVLHLAAEKGHLNIVSFYTSRLPDPNPRMLTNDELRGSTPLHFAAENGHFDCVGKSNFQFKIPPPDGDNSMSAKCVFPTSLFDKAKKKGGQLVIFLSRVM